MNVLLLSWVIAGMAHAACDLDAAVADVRERGAREGYTCLMGDEGGAARVERALLESAGDEPRLTRALAMWLLERPDLAWEAAMVAHLGPADIRLLVDGVKARRGRKSPVPEHAAVFSQFPWYQPIDSYTDGRLREIDRANLQTLERPPTDAAEVVTPVAEAAPVEEPPSRAAGIVLGGLVLLGVIYALVRGKKAA